jgi:hypothetical protein
LHSTAIAQPAQTSGQATPIPRFDATVFMQSTNLCITGLAANVMVAFVFRQVL